MEKENKVQYSYVEQELVDLLDKLSMNLREYYDNRSFPMIKLVKFINHLNGNTSHMTIKLIYKEFKKKSFFSKEEVVEYKEIPLIRLYNSDIFDIYNDITKQKEELLSLGKTNHEIHQTLVQGIEDWLIYRSNNDSYNKGLDILDKIKKNDK